MNIPSLVLFMKNSRLVGLVPCWQRTGAVISTKDRHILKEKRDSLFFLPIGAPNYGARFWEIVSFILFLRRGILSSYFK